MKNNFSSSRKEKYGSAAAAAPALTGSKNQFLEKLKIKYSFITIRVQQSGPSQDNSINLRTTTRTSANNETGEEEKTTQMGHGDPI